MRSDAVTRDHRADWYCDPRIGGVCNHESRPHMTGDLHRYVFAACYAKLFDRSPELRTIRPLCCRSIAMLPLRPKRNISTTGSGSSHLAKDGHYLSTTTKRSAGH